MDQPLLKRILEDFSIYQAMIRQCGAPDGLAITGGCYDADRFNWSRVKSVKVHYDQDFRPRKIEHTELGVTYRFQP